MGSVEQLALCSDIFSVERDRVSCLYLENTKMLLCVPIRLRSAYASAKYDQSLGFPHEERLSPSLSTVPSKHSDKTGDTQADLSFRLEHTHFVAFIISWPTFLEQT